MDTLIQDLRYALRALRRTPGFTVVAVLTLALGIGANTAIFSVVNGVLLRPLPYPDPDRVVGVWNSWQGTPRGQVSPAEYFDYLERVDAFAQFGAYGTGYSSLTGEGEPERIPTGILTYGVLPTLGVTPALGRGFTESEDRRGNEHVVLLSDGLWRRRFGASAAVIGRRIVLDAEPYTVAGVMPPGFRLPDEFQSSTPSQLFVPAALERPAPLDRGSHFLSGIARLKAGITRDAASASIGAVAAKFRVDLPSEYPPDQQFSARVTSLHEDVIGEIRPTLLILLCAIGFVLLIACANLTNLFLSRTEARHREFAVRTALGALRGRLIRQGLVESGIVALLGGAAGVALAWWGTGVLLALRPPDLPRLEGVSIDPTVLLFALAVSLLAGLLVGLAPALRASRLDLQAGLKENARGATAGSGQQRLRRALVASEVALALVLLLGAGLLARSFARLLAVDPGYRTDHLLTVSLNLPVATYPDGARTAGFFVSLLERVRAQQGVVAAGAVAGLPLASHRGDLNFEIEGQPVVPGHRARADWQVITPGYFDAIDMRLVRGRGIEVADREDTPGVVVINETTARRYWPTGDPIGARFKLGGGAGPGWVTVVGIVKDVRHSSLRADPEAEMYLAHTQFHFWGGGGPLRSLTVVARGSADPSPLAAVIRREVAALDPALPVGAVRTMDEVRGESVAAPRFILLLISIFSGVALLVALIGVYGVMAYSVAQRRQEIGLRVALGADPRGVVALVLRQGMMPAVAGIVGGLAAGLALTSVLRTLLFQVGPHDPGTVLAVSAIVALVAFVACYVPARRAAGVDPVVALRAE